MYQNMNVNLSNKGLIGHEDVDQAGQGGVPWVVDNNLIHVFSESLRFLWLFIVSHFWFSKFNTYYTIVWLQFYYYCAEQSFWCQVFFSFLTFLHKRFILLTCTSASQTNQQINHSIFLWILSNHKCRILKSCLSSFWFEI